MELLPENRSITNTDGKYNLIFATLCNIGDGLKDALENPHTQAKFSYKGTVLDRMHGCDSNNTLFAQLCQENKVLQAGNSMAAVTSSKTNPFVPLTADLSGFATSQYIAINQGGMGLFLQLF